MRNRIGMAMFLMAATVLATGGERGSSSSGQAPLAQGRSAASAGANHPRKVLHYRDPMGGSDTSGTPKKDAMGMDYVAVYADGKP